MRLASGVQNTSVDGPGKARAPGEDRAVLVVDRRAPRAARRPVAGSTSRAHPRRRLSERPRRSVVLEPNRTGPVRRWCDTRCGPRLHVNPASVTTLVLGSPCPARRKYKRERPRSRATSVRLRILPVAYEARTSSEDHSTVMTSTGRRRVLFLKSAAYHEI